jgi:hypothetical protein
MFPSFQNRIQTSKRKRDSSVGIVTRYGLHGPRIESRLGEGGGRDFPRPTRPSLLHNGYRVFQVGKAAGGVALTTPHLVPRLKKEQSYTSTPPFGHSNHTKYDVGAATTQLSMVYWAFMCRTYKTDPFTHCVYAPCKFLDSSHVLLDENKQKEIWRYRNLRVESYKERKTNFIINP